MRLVVDLHAHSGYAGGVGDIPLPAVARAMARKGIDVFATGDCLQPAWLEKLESLLIEREAGFFALADAEDNAGRAARFVLQSEIIVTADAPGGGRKSTHLALLFPGFAAAREALRRLRRWGVKVGMGRPFLKCGGPAEVAERLFALEAAAPGEVLFFPAHVLTPSGVYGPERPVTGLAEAFGAFAERIRVVETGLSADPEILALIPELDGRTLISNSDAHGPAPNRLGREYTVLDAAGRSYADLLAALYERRVRYTVEFNPAEGRYFLTGHRAGLAGHGGRGCYFSPDRTPPDGRCPICGKPLTVGVLERALQLARAQAAPGAKPRTLKTARPRQRGVRLVPLAEVVAAGLGLRNVSAKRNLAVFDAVLKIFGTEVDVWERAPAELSRALEGRAPPAVAEAIVRVRRGRFGFDPPGHDGVYGSLRINAAPARRDGKGEKGTRPTDGWFGLRHVDGE